jgi:hypothetical protein
MCVVEGTVAAAVVGDLVVSHVGQPWQELNGGYSFARMHELEQRCCLGLTAAAGRAVAACLLAMVASCNEHRLPDRSDQH